MFLRKIIRACKTIINGNNPELQKLNENLDTLNKNLVQILHLVGQQNCKLEQLSNPPLYTANENLDTLNKNLVQILHLVGQQNCKLEQLANASLYRELGKRLTPRLAQGIALKRFGRNSDGGYILADCLENTALAFSFGVCDDASFELDLAERGVEVRLFDPTVPGPPCAHPLFKFQCLGLAGENLRLMPRMASCNYTSLRRILADNEPEGAKAGGLLLKMDIEGFEYEALPEASDLLEHFDQIVFELHFLSNPAFAARAISLLDMLTETHQIVHIHGNNCGPALAIGGFFLNDCIELSLLRRKGRQFTAPRHYAPTSLDWPNNPLQPEWTAFYQEKECR